MFKRLLIGAGLTLLLALIGFWVYLLIFGTPDAAEEIFTNLRSSDGAVERLEIVTGEDSKDADQIDLGDNLNQLTTRAVAGFQTIVSTTTSKVLYAEQGTGHVYEIDLSSGLENRLSGVTVNKTVAAYFDQTAAAVVLVSETSDRTNATLYRLEATGLKQLTSLGPAYNLNFLSSNELFYTVATGEELVGRLYDLELAVDSETWRLPLTEVDVYQTNTYTYVVTRPAPYLEGNLYRLTNGELRPLHDAFYGFTALPLSDESILETYYDFDVGLPVSSYLNSETESRLELPILVIPEKCDGFKNNEQVVWCAAPATPVNNLSRETLSDWQKGQITIDDELWRIDFENNKVVQILDFMEETGFILDVEKLTVDSSGRNILFTNKLNNQLWHYKNQTLKPADALTSSENPPPTNGVDD